MQISGEHDVPGAIFKGHVKSLDDRGRRGFGFIECAQTFRKYRRDVFLHRKELPPALPPLLRGMQVLFEVFLRDDGKPQAGGLFIGADVTFTIVFQSGPGKPQARSVLWSSGDSDDRSLGQSSCAPIPYDVPPTSSAFDALDRWYSQDPRRCQFDLDQYSKTLHHLHVLLTGPFGKKGGDHIRNILKQAKSCLRCSKCRQDEFVRGSCVLSLLDEVDARWEDPRRASHFALERALSSHLSPPPEEPDELLISRLRFIQGYHSKKSSQGALAGHTIDRLVHELQSGAISTKDPSMVLNVVFFHGEYRSLNNRNAVSLVRYGAGVQPSIYHPPICFVRTWPLVRQLRLDDGSCQDLLAKTRDEYPRA